DQLERLFGDLLVHRADAGNVIADIADLVDGERGLVMADGQNAVFVRRVLADDDRDYALQCERTRRINALDECVRVWRVQDLANEHAGHAEVVRVLARASGFAGGVNEGDGFTDDGKIAHLLASPCCSALIAALIAWYICV